VKIWKDTLYEYYQNIKKVFFGYELENIYAPLRGNKKFYLYNLWFHTILGTAPDFGQSFENVLFLELKKKFDHIFFKKGEKKNAEEGLTTDSKKQGGEIDFYLEARDTHPFNKDFNIQACYQLTKENLEREIWPLLKAKGKNSIVYFEKEADLPNEQDGIKIMSFFDFVKEYCN
jgi:predicted AAA+ superfamily ATPase